MRVLVKGDTLQLGMAVAERVPNSLSRRLPLQSQMRPILVVFSLPAFKLATEILPAAEGSPFVEFFGIGLMAPLNLPLPTCPGFLSSYMRLSPIRLPWWGKRYEPLKVPHPLWPKNG